MKIRHVLAAGVLAAAIAGAGSASALVAPKAPTVKTAKQGGSGGKGNGDTSGNHDTNSTLYWDCDDTSAGETTTAPPAGDNYLKYVGPTTIWPPNHKLRSWTLSATDGSGDMSTLFTTTTSSEPANDVGDGNTAQDTADDYSDSMNAASGTPTATATGTVRAERSGTGVGRLYTINAMATFDNGSSSCTHAFEAFVPHDQGNHNGSGKLAALARRS